MNYLERVQRAYEYARKNEGLLRSLARSFGQEQARMAMKSGRDETARMMMEIAGSHGNPAGMLHPMADRLEEACFGNPSLYSHYMEKLQDFSLTCNHTRSQVMGAVGELYEVRAPHLSMGNPQDGTFWGNCPEWDACVVQNPEIAAVSPYSADSSYVRALVQSRERLHCFLEPRQHDKDFQLEDMCRLMLEDREIHLEMADYREIVQNHPRLVTLLPQDVLGSEGFRDTLLENDPVGALCSIPREEQTDSLRLRAISKDAGAFRWIDDDDFKRRYYTIREMIPMRLENQPSLEQCRAIQDKATSLLEAIGKNDTEHKEQIAGQNWMERIQADGHAVNEEVEAGKAPRDFSEVARFHYGEHVTTDNAQEQFCYYDDADGTLDYNRDTQRFTFTSREGRQSDMTDSMGTLKKSGRRFQSLDEDEKHSFLSMKDFSLTDSKGRMQDYVAQRSQDGSVSFMSKLSSKAVGSATAMAVGKVKKLWDDAMAAGQL